MVALLVSAAVDLEPRYPRAVVALRVSWPR
jgi:hypothetical protein